MRVHVAAGLAGPVGCSVKRPRGRHGHDPGRGQGPTGMLDHVIVITGDVDPARDG